MRKSALWRAFALSEKTIWYEKRKHVIRNSGNKTMVQTADKAAEQVRNRNGDEIFLYAAAYFAQAGTSSFAREGTGSKIGKYFLKKSCIIFREKSKNMGYEAKNYARR